MANKFSYKQNDYGVGDTVSVTYKVVEGEKTRQQVFTGLVIATGGRQDNKSFTVRKISTAGVGVERIWPVLSPEISDVALVSKGRARRSKLYYLRNRTGKSAIRVKAEIKVKNEPKKPSTGKKGRTASKKLPKK